ncbi:hypothetical protein AVEN_51875-1 [Araneus ventricosus]|uniref:Uncharacterized protein n=1 Tax=Araneus ventricosus TaxID=182803 RepID=A0A4Y1ZR32_ARAVE|nr:hypothetical protein AVEN_51875-1 [Araneus ventricosus]
MHKKYICNIIHCTLFEEGQNLQKEDCPPTLKEGLSTHPKRRTIHPNRRTVEPKRRTVEPKRRTVQPKIRTVHPKRRTVHPKRKTVGHLSLRAFRDFS